MTPEEFIKHNVDIKTASTAYLLDSDFIRNLLNKYANHRVDEWEKKRLADLQNQLAEIVG